MRTFKQSTFTILLISLLLSAFNSCKKDDDAVAEFTISTGEISELNGNFAVASGKLRLTSGTVTSYGHCWSAFSQPTIESDSKSDHGSSSGAIEYTSSMDNLKAGTIHYVRAYAKDKDKIVYGNEMPFMTANLLVGSVYASAQTATTVNLGAKITIYSDPVVKYGFCWATHDNPSVLDSKKEFSFMDETQSFYASITGLQTKTTYYFRAYALSNQQAYGPVVSVYLDNINLGANTLVQIDDTTVNIETEIIFSGVTIVQHGHCYSTNPNPDIDGDHTELGILQSAGSFSSVVLDLKIDELYYYRAYVKTEDTIVYSKETKYQLVHPWIIQNFPGGGRTLPLVFSIDGECYLGFGDNFENDVWLYDLNNNTWKEKSNFPENLYGGNAYAMSNAGHAFILVNNHIVTGLQYKPDSDSWTNMPDLEFEFSGKNIESTFVQERLLVSITEYNNNELHLFELVENEWLEKSSRVTVSQNEFLAFNINGKAYWVAIDLSQNYLWEYDIGLDKWSKKSDPITTFDDYQLSYSYNDKGYVHGKTIVHAYDPVDDVWSMANIYSHNSKDGAAIIINDNLYIGMGNQSARFYYYNPDW